MAPPAKIVCAYCQGPLAAELGVVICTYCGKPNNPSGLPGKTAIKEVVREVVREDANGNGVPDMLERPSTSPPREPAHVAVKPGSTTAVWAVAGATGVLIVMGVVLALVASGPTDRSVEARAFVPSQTAVALPTAPKPTLGKPKFIQVHGDSVYVATSTHLVRASRGTLTPRWSTPMEGDAQYFLLHGNRIIVSTRAAALFFDVESGAQEARYGFKDPVFGSNSACVVDGQVLFDLSFERQPLRLDLATGKKTQGDKRCQPTEINTRCPADQACGRSRVKLQDFDCEFELRVGDGRVASCKVDDGTTRSAVVAFGANNAPRWTIYSEGQAVRALFMAAAGDLVVVAEARNLSAYDAASGQMRWQQRTGDYDGAVTTDGTFLYTTNPEGFIAAFALATGEQVAAL